MIKAVIQFGLRKNFRGFGFLVKYFFKEGRICLKNKFGASFFLDPFQKIDYAVIKNGYFDEDVYNALLANLKEGDVLWDIGANIGMHSITIKKNLPSVTCLAFEPFPDNFHKLRENVKLNKLSIKCYNFALHNGLDLKKMYSFPNNAGLTGFNEIEKSFDTEIEVPTFSGDFIVDTFSVKKPNVIKIDTEGNELNILTGLKSMFKSGELHTVIFECNHGLNELMMFFRSQNFEVKRLSESPNFIARRIKK